MFNYILYRIGQFIALNLPLKIAYRVAVFFSDVHYIFADKDRFLVLENLKAIFPQKPVKELKEIRLQMTRNFAKYLVDFFRFENIDEEYVRKNIKIENQHYIDESLARKKGVIVLSAHIGNWELGGVTVALLGYPIAVVALSHKYKKVNDFFVRQRESKGVGVIPFERAVKQCLSALSENKLLGLVGDRDFTQRGVIVDFFGKPTLLPMGPAGFALKTGAAILPAFMVRNHDDSFTLRLEKPIIYKSSRKNGSKNNNLHEVICGYKIILEDYIRKYPDQWYMFRQFWQ